jgi:integrase
LPILWRAACEAKSPLGAYLLVRLRCGQRHSETAAMRWCDLDLEAGVWTVPAEVGKTRPLRAPLPRLVRVILRGLPRRGGLVFAGRGGKPMTGWTKRLVPVYEATAAAGMEPWMPGNLRKTVRSGLDELGVPNKVAELMMGHGPRDDLLARYDRAERWPERRAAARRWVLHVLRHVKRRKAVGAA